MNRSKNKEVKIVKKKNEDSNAKEDVKSVMGVQKKTPKSSLSVYSVNRINLGLVWDGNR